MYDRLGRSNSVLPRISSKDIIFCFNEYLLLAETATIWCDLGSFFSLVIWVGGASSSNNAVFPPI